MTLMSDHYFLDGIEALLLACRADNQSYVLTKSYMALTITLGANLVLVICAIVHAGYV